jgi:hypothetical protein
MEEPMPFDAATRVYTSPVQDTLADIDKTKPLSIPHIKRVVRAARAAGLLAMDHPEELRCTRDLNRETPYMSPHGAVDAFLDTDNRSSCPCNFNSRSHGFIERINNLHRRILFWTAVDPERPEIPYLREEFDRLLLG